MSDFLTGITGTNYIDYTESASNLKDTITSTDYSSATDEELMEACKSFEQYFVEQVFKGMEKTIPKSDDEKSSASSSYTDMFMDTLYQEYSGMVTERGDGLGIAKMLYEQMKRNYSL